MNETNWLSYVGVLIYVIITIIDRFIIEMSDILYIIFGVISICFILVSLILNKRVKKNGKR